MTIKDIATAAQSLANYCYRAGEDAEIEVIDGQLKLLTDRLKVIKQERTRDTVTEVDVRWKEGYHGEELGKVST